MEIHGHCHDRFASVRDVFRQNFEERDELGASVAVTLDGELVVDLWAGHVDRQRTLPWQENTIVNVYSTTKTMTALSALVLADRGELDFTAPVARYWPEFSAAGKEDVRVSHLMAHTAGLSGLDEPTTPEDLYDWEKITGLLAAQAPWWEPGSASGYHALTQGYLVGEVVRRITGRTLGTFFREEIAALLGADFHIGTGPEYDGRVGALVPPEAAPAAAGGPDSIAARTFASPWSPASRSATVEWRRAEIPAANGHGNARSVATAQAVLACGGEVGGRRLLSESGARRALEEQVDGTDLVLDVPLRHGMGYGLVNDAVPLSPNRDDACFWGGWGGSSIVVDLRERMSFAYVMNRMESGVMGDPRGFLLGQAVYEGLGGPGPEGAG